MDWHFCGYFIMFWFSICWFCLVKKRDIGVLCKYKYTCPFINMDIDFGKYKWFPGRWQFFTYDILVLCDWTLVIWTKRADDRVFCCCFCSFFYVFRFSHLTQMCLVNMFFEQELVLRFSDQSYFFKFGRLFVLLSLVHFI